MQNKMTFALTVLTMPFVLAAFAPESPTVAQHGEVRTQQEEKPQEEKEAKVRRLLQLTGAADMGKQVMDRMLDQFAAISGLPDGFIEKFKKLAKPAELVDLVVPINMKHLDEKTLDAALAFWSSPEGQKFQKAQPKILAESMAAGQKWGTELAAKVIAELAKDK